MSLESFEEIALEYQPLILGQLKQLNIYQNHEEFYQIGLIALWEAWIKFDAKKGVFPAFAKIYVRGKLLHHLKRERVYEERNFLQLEEEKVDDTATATKIDTDFELASLLPYLSEREQLWLIEFCEKGKKPKEIANEQRVSVETVKSWRKGAIRKLRLVMQK